MSAPADSTQEPLRLHFKEVHKVQIITEDDRYNTTLAEMKAACKASEELKIWKTHFEDFLAHIYRWCADQREIIVGCYLAPTSEGLKVFVTTHGEAFHFDFADCLTELELELARLYPMCPVEVLQMPSSSPDSLRSFFSPEKAYQLYGQS
jgi:hypothetical protein